MCVCVCVCVCAVYFNINCGGRDADGRTEFSLRIRTFEVERTFLFLLRLR
jgi:hypothetical protein